MPDAFWFGFWAALGAIGALSLGVSLALALVGVTLIGVGDGTRRP